MLTGELSRLSHGDGVRVVVEEDWRGIDKVEDGLCP